MIVDENNDDTEVLPDDEQLKGDTTKPSGVDSQVEAIEAVEDDPIIEEGEAEPEVPAEPCFENTDAEELEFSGDELESLKSDNSKKSKGSKPKSKRPRKSKKVAKTNDQEDEELDNLGDLSGVDDPLAPAFDLDRGAPLPMYEDALPWKSKIATAKEFFNTEILYRFDIMDPAAVKPLKGSYRIELDGEGGGTWNLNIDSQLDVSSGDEKADTVLSLHKRDFLNIVNGKLNPQLAILSKKIKVKGKVRQAISLQEILSPSPE